MLLAGRSHPGRGVEGFLLLREPWHVPRPTRGGMEAWSLLEMWGVAAVSREGNGAGGAQPGQKEAQDGPCGSAQLPDRRGTAR